MSNKVASFYHNRQNILKEIREQIRDIFLILNKQKNDIEIRQVEQSLKNYSENYGKK